MTVVPAEKLHFDLVGSRSVTQRVDGLWDEFVGWHDFRRRPSAEFVEILRHTLSMVLLNLILSPDSWIAVIGNPDWYQRHKPLLGPLITYASVKKVERFLRENGYVSFRKGRASGTKSFWRPNAIRATEKLLKLLKDGDRHSPVHDVRPDPLHYPIRLRSAPDVEGHKRFIPFEYSGEHMLMADRLATINKALLRHWPDIEISDAEQRKMLQQMSERDPDYATLNLGRRTLYRVFNNGTFEDGGRFYGGWWQNVPKGYRPYITINGKQTVEVDYSAIHPTILYDELGIEKPEDPYTIGIGDRELVKKTFNALINAKGSHIRRLEEFSEADVGMPWEQFLEAGEDAFLAVQEVLWDRLRSEAPKA